MTELQQKQLAFLEDTVAFYNREKLCISGTGACYYFMEGKQGCAIGRHLTPELAKQLDIINDSTTAVSNDKVFNLLPENLQELGQSFLIRIQSLHDERFYWDEHGLNESGRDRVRRIKLQFGLGA